MSSFEDKSRSPRKVFLSKIQFFRGFAIILVVLYHLKVPFFGWGFIGVDIFFVLSGFLMMSLYPKLSDLNQIGKFYRSRYLRIYPILTITLVISFIYGYFFLLPNESFLVLKASLFGMLGLSNLDYWLSDQYFVSSMFRPLLNLWSLGVELQFYLIYPLLLKLFSKYPKSIYVLFFSSFFLFIILSEVSPQTVFFLLPFRIWEFLAGIFLARTSSYSSLAFDSIRKIQKRQLLSVLLFISATVALVEQTASFFAVMVLLSVLSTTVFLALRLKLKNKLLITATRLITTLGNYSYAIYLLHFPIIVLTNYMPLEGNRLGIYSIVDLLKICILVGSLAFLSRKFVENRIRVSTNFQHSFNIAIPFVTIFLAVSVIANFNARQFSVYPKDSIHREVAFAVEDQGSYRCGALSRLDFLQQFETFQSCTLNQKNFPNRALLVGNSHADAIKEVLAEILSSMNTSLTIFSENRSLDDILVSRIQQLHLRQHFRTIILHSSPGANDTNSLEKLALWSEENNIELRIIGPVPTYRISIPLQILNGDVDVQTISDFEESNKGEIQYYKRLSSEFDGVKFFDLGPVFCPRVCITREPLSNKIIYRDHGHLSLSAKKILFKPLASFLAF